MSTRSAWILRIALAATAAALLSFALACGGDDDEEGVDAPTATESAGDSTDDAEDTGSDSSNDTGGDSGDDSAASPELEGYFEDIDAVFEDADAQSDELEDAFNAAYDQATTVEEAKQALGSFLLDTYSIHSDALEALDEIEPPDEAEEAHDAFVAAAQDLLDLSQELFQGLQDVETEEDLNALSTDYEDEGSAKAAAADDACFALQDIADEAGIDIDLNCED